VGHEGEADLPRREYAEQLVLEPPAQGSVQGREGLVHQEDVGIADEGPAEGDALRETARQLGGIGSAEISQAEKLEDFCDAKRAFPLGPSRAEAEGDVARNGERAEEPRFLEHETEPGAFAPRRKPRVGTLQAGRDAQEGRLARAARPDDGRGLALPQLEVDAVDRPYRAAARAIRLADAPEAQVRHCASRRAQGRSLVEAA